MADPISIFGLIVSVGQVLGAICTISGQLKEAANDIHSIYSQLCSLKGVLEEIGKATTDGSNVQLSILLESEYFKNTLQICHGLLIELGNDLKTFQKPLKKAITIALWPTKLPNIQKKSRELEKVKTLMILAMLNGTSTQVHKLYSELDEVKKMVKEGYEWRRVQDIKHKRKEVSDMIDMLEPFSPRGKHERCRQICQAGTGTWFLEKYFPEWLRKDTGQRSILCLNGKSGAGKTILISGAIEILELMAQEKGDIGFAYFYCSYDDVLSDESSIIFGSFIAQLIRRHPKLFEDLPTEWQTSRPTVLEMERVLRYLSRQLSELVLFIDAVNETKGRALLVHCIIELVSRSPNIRIVLTSTPEPGLSRLRGYTNISIPSDALESDMRTYINARLAMDDNLSNKSEELKNKIRTTLIEKANGMFRWVQCQIDHLCTRYTEKAMLKALGELPKDLNETYAKMLLRIPENDHDIVRDSLQWLCYARRPVKLVELCEAVMYEDGEPKIGPESRLQQPEIILRICQGFVVLNPVLLTITFAHPSVRDFLTSDKVPFRDVQFKMDKEEAYRTIVSKSISYIMMDCFTDGFSDIQNHHRLVEEYPLLEYAVLWPHFVGESRRSQSGIDQAQLEQVMKLFMTHQLENGGNFSCWVACIYPDADGDTIRSTTPLYCAAAFGIKQIVSELLESDKRVDIDAPGGRHLCTALCVASYNGHSEVVRLLLEKGANPNTKDKEGFSCCFWAKARGNDTCERLLREKGAEVIMPDPVTLEHSGSVSSSTKDNDSLDPSRIFCWKCRRALSRYNIFGKCPACGNNWESVFNDPELQEQWELEMMAC